MLNINYHCHLYASQITFYGAELWIGVESGTPVNFDKAFDTAWKFNLRRGPDRRRSRPRHTPNFPEYHS